jgi:hypothetical protein
VAASPDPNCPKCGGTGHIFIDNLNAKRCSCLLKSLYAQKLGRLYRYPLPKNSSLLKKLDKNLFLVIDDDDVGPHLKAAFVKLGLGSRWAYITDSDVLQAWLNQPNSVNASNISDLAEYPFLVLRLGVQGYKNIALSGVLCELLMHRVLSYRPTWIVSPRPLSKDCLEWSDELDTLLRRYFESNSFKRRAEQDNREREIERQVMEEEDTSVDDLIDLKPKKRTTKGNALANVNDILRQTRRKK